MATRRRQAGLRGRHARRGPGPDDRQRFEARARREGPVGHDHRGRAVVHARRVARGDAEALDLGVQRLQRRQLLQCRGPPGMLVDREGEPRPVAAGSPRAARSRRRSCPRRSRRSARWWERNAHSSISPAVMPALDRGIPADGDRHVPDRGVGRLAVAGREPVLFPLRRSRERRRFVLGRGRAGLDAAGHHHPVHARMTDAAALCSAASPEAQCRLCAMPGAFTRPASIAA